MQQRIWRCSALLILFLFSFFPADRVLYAANPSCNLRIEVIAAYNLNTWVDTINMQDAVDNIGPCHRIQYPGGANILAVADETVEVSLKALRRQEKTVSPSFVAVAFFVVSPAWIKEGKVL
jgi:hypothetical protein